MTASDIVEIPAAPNVPPYPALGSANFNDEAYAVGSSMPAVVSGIRAIAVAGRECAVLARQAAQGAQESEANVSETRDQALQAISAARAGAVDAVEQTGAGIVSDLVSDATAARDAALQSKNEAAASAAAAQGTLNYKGEWSTLAGPLAPPATVSHDLQLWSLVAPTAAVEADQPGISTKWIIVRERAPIGTVYTGSQPPREGSWLEMDTLYLKSAYPELAAKLGRINPGEFTWTTAVFPFADTAYAAKVWELAGGRLFASGNRTGYAALWSYSDNSGATWTACTGVPINTSTPQPVSVVTANGIALVLQSGVIWRSTDNGASWAQLSSNPGGASLTNLKVFGGVFVGSNNTGTAQTSTTGANNAWTPVAVTLDGASMLSAPFNDAVYSAAHGTYLLRHNSGAILRSTDGFAWTTLMKPQFSSSYTQVQLAVFSDVVGAIYPSFGDRYSLAYTYSRDLVTWRTRYIAAPDGQQLGMNVSLSAAADIDKNFVCFGGGTAGAFGVLGIDGSFRFAPTRLPTGGGSIRKVGGVLRTEGLPAAFLRAPLYSYNESTQFLTPSNSAPLGVNQWIKAA